MSNKFPSPTLLLQIFLEVEAISCWPYYSLKLARHLSCLEMVHSILLWACSMFLGRVRFCPIEWKNIVLIWVRSFLKGHCLTGAYMCNSRFEYIYWISWVPIIVNKDGNKKCLNVRRRRGL